MRKKNTTIQKSIIIFPVLLSGISILFTGCTRKNKTISRTEVLFDTVVTITLYDSKYQDALDECITLGKKYEQLFSRTDETSEISQINEAEGSPVTVSDDTLELIQEGLYYSELSGGSFDITIEPVSSLWDFKSEDPSVPDEAAIQEAVSHVDYRQVHIEGNQVWLEDPEGGLDLGGIAKGFIADKLKAYLTGQGVTSGIINLGGNVLTIGEKPDGSAYVIGIQYPFGEQNETITTEEVRDMSMVSSGVYERYFRIGEQLYHHILNPDTGYPYENNLLGVTILSPRSVDGDGLSTTCFALGLEEGTKLINSLDGIEAIFITDNYELHYTDR